MNYLNILKKQKLKKLGLVEILFYILPLSFVAGNLIVSINLLLFLIFSLYLIKKKNLTYRFSEINWFLIIFFLYLFFSTVIQFNDYDVWIQKAREAVVDQPLEKNLNPSWLKENLTFENHPIFKSLLLLRFVILIFVIDTLFYNKILSLKKFFLSSVFCTSFVSMDIIFQYIFGFDIFGFSNNGRYNSGPFGDELIAGGYLLHFSFISFFYIFYKSKNLNNPLILFTVAVHALAIALAGNRMPLVLFIFGCFLLILFIKKIRTVIISSLIIFLTIFSVVLLNDDKIKIPFRSFYYQTLHAGIIKHFIIKHDEKEEIKKEEENEVYKVGPDGKIDNILRTSGHARIYLTAIEMWKENHIFGFGQKSFRVKCWEILGRIEGLSCANHPHNYYLEILSEVGLIGFSLIIVFFILLLRECFVFLNKKKYKKNKSLYLLIPIIIIFFLGIWPLKSTGSFFTNWGGSLFWLNIALLQANLINKKN